MAKLRVFLLHGPNLNMLGTREPGIYGNVTYEQLMSQVLSWSEQLDIELGYAQSNSEGGLIDYIQASLGQFDVIILNPGAYTHTSYAIRDAIVSVGLPVIEVHISNIFAREEWRAKSLISPVCSGSICGLGIIGYRLALEAASGMAGAEADTAAAPAASAGSFADVNEAPAHFSREAAEAEFASAFAAASAAAGSDAKSISNALSLDLSDSGRGKNSGYSAPKQEKKAAKPIVSVVENDLDHDDLSNLFMPTQRYEVNVQNGAIDLGNNCGINEINGFGEEGVESVFAGDDDEELTDAEREKLKAWMGDDDMSASSGRMPEYDTDTSAFQPGETGNQYGSSDSYRAIASSGFFSNASAAKTVSASSSAPKRLSIPIKAKKK